jgi:signal transduction histidine kinase
MAVAGDRELPRILEQGLGEAPDNFSEYIDQGRFPDRSYQNAFRDFLRVKYRGQRMDLVIAVQPAAIEFVHQRRDELFPDTPVVFMALSPQAKRLPNSTGVVADLNLAGSLSLALQLQPDVRNVFVVSGTGLPDKEYERVTRQQLRPFESKLSVTYLSGLVTSDLEQRLAQLPDRSIVYYLAVYRDGAGQDFAPMGYSERVSSVARAPTYTWSDALMGHGVTGGSLLDRQAMMEAVGRVGVRVLRGEPADSIPVSAPELHTNQIDWRQLRRWGISESRVPAGTRVLFREPTLWDSYSTYIVGAAAILLAQTALIGGLLIQRSRRRQAEQLVRGGQAQLRASYDRIRDLGGRLLNAQEGERSRIARELHDDISQQLAALSLSISGLKRQSGVLDGGAIGVSLSTLHKRTLDLADSVRRLSHDLHPSMLQQVGLRAALESHCTEFQQQNGIDVTFYTAEDVTVVLPDAALCLYRAAQEALRNVAKHAEARRTQVVLSRENDELTLTIVDDGKGFDKALVHRRGGGLGLLSIEERARLLHGSVRIETAGQRGTIVRVAIPAAANRSPAAEFC